LVASRGTPCSSLYPLSLHDALPIFAANAGVSLGRSFHQAASEPCGSVSIRATGPAPASSAWTAMWPASVVLPDPPFWEQSATTRSEEHTSELQSRENLVCRLLLEKK